MSITEAINVFSLLAIKLKLKLGFNMLMARYFAVKASATYSKYYTYSIPIVKKKLSF